MTSAILAETPEERAFWPRPFWPPRNWWLALLAILVLAGALRYPAYNFSLPAIADGDEAHHSLSGRYIINEGSARPLGQDGYPPGIIRVYTFFLRFFQEPGTPTASVIWMVRLLAITTSLGIVLVLALLGHHTLGPPYGLIGALFWTISPYFVERSRLATAEIFLIFFSALALWLALAAALWRRERWSTYATYALMLAVLFKYTVAFMAPILLLLPLWQGRAGWGECFRNLVLFAAFSAWLIFLTPAFAPIDPDILARNWSAHNEFAGVPAPQTLWNVFRTTLAVLNLPIMIPGWLGVAILLRGRKREVTFSIAILLLIALAWLFGVSLWGDQGIHSQRFLIFMTTVLVTLAGWGYAAGAQWVYLWLTLSEAKGGAARPFGRWPGPLTGLLLFIIFLPQLAGSIADLRDHLKTDPRTFVMEYMDLTVAGGGYISPHDTRLLNPHWGGYGGATPFTLSHKFAIRDQSIVEHRAQGALYAILNHDEYADLLESDPDGILNQTTRLKGWEHQPNYRKPAMVVLRLYPIQHAATGQLGPIRLIGYDLTQESVGPGDMLPFHLYWQADATTEADYQVFNHLLDEDGNLVAQADGPPLPDPLLRRGTKDWDDPEEIIYSREYLLQLPEDLIPGEYTLVTGFYRRDNGQRLLSPAGEDALWVTRIAVE